MFELNTFEEATRRAIRDACSDDKRVLDLMDALPLPEKLLRVGATLGETAEELRAERRTLLGQVISYRAPDLDSPTASQIKAMRRTASELRVITKHDNTEEMIFQIVEWKMIGERVERIEAMARA